MKIDLTLREIKLLYYALDGTTKEYQNISEKLRKAIELSQKTSSKEGGKGK